MNLLREIVHCNSCTSPQIQPACLAELVELPLAAAIDSVPAFVGTAVATAVAAVVASAASAAVAAAAAAAVVVETIGVLAVAFAAAAAVAAVDVKECLA